MLTLSQIGALIGLLMAFGVDTPTINNVKAILGDTGGIGASTSAIVSIPTFTLVSQEEGGYFSTGKKVTLATFDVYASDRNLRGDTFKMDYKFSTSSKFMSTTTEETAVVSTTCKGTLDKGMHGTCVVEAKFSKAGDYYFSLKSPSIKGERTNQLYKTDVIVEDGVIKIR